MTNNKYIDEKIFFDEIEEPLQVLEDILTIMIKSMPTVENNTIPKVEELKAINIINAFCKNNSLELVNLSNLSIGASYAQFRANLNSRLTSLFTKEISKKYDELFQKKLYKLDKDELKNVQSLINLLRDKINKIEGLEKKHVARILKKLNEMQTELNKPISTFDTLIGKSISIINTIRHARKEVIAPVMKDAIELTKELNKMDSIHCNIPESKNQLGFEELIRIEE